jgi:hypothetical protein
MFQLHNRPLYNTRSREAKSSFLPFSFASVTVYQLGLLIIFAFKHLFMDARHGVPSDHEARPSCHTKPIGRGWVVSFSDNAVAA